MRTLCFEQLQTHLDEGPCLLAYRSGEAVAVPDLTTDTRFAVFGPAASDAGLAAVFTFPLHHGDNQLGALDLYRDTAGALDVQDMEAAQTLADVAAAYLLNAESREEALRNSDAFHHSAQHDALTGLPNRLLLQQRIEHAAERAQRSGAAAAILFTDLNGFKRVNDAHGHHVGDELLIAVAERLSGLVRPGDTLSRISGDEFVLLCEDLASREDATALAHRIDAAFGEPFELKDAGIAVAITPSVGIAYAGPGDAISGQLVIDADLAMYQAKRTADARHHIIDLRPALDNDTDEELEQDLRSSLTDGTLALAYQPIVRTVDGSVTGVEALLRWTHPVRGPISPLVGIAIAEKSGLINDIGAWVLERSGRDRARWLDQSPEGPLDLSVNVSARQLLSAGFCGQVSDMLATTGMEPSALILEITENILVEDDERSMTVLSDLKALGVQLALDDFGTGFSSLSYLRRLPIDIVKIDQTFVSDLDAALEGGAIVAAVTNLAHVLGLTVTAEGVETTSQRNKVQALGCDASQGFYYAKAMPATAIEARLRTSTSPPGDPHSGDDEKIPVASGMAVFAPPRDATNFPQQR